MKLFLLTFLALFSLNANAALQGAPFIPEVDKRFHALEGEGVEGNKIAKKYAHAIYDVDVDGGASAEENLLGVKIPAGSIITGVLFYIHEQFADSGNGSVKVQCASDADLMIYRDLTGLTAASVLYGQVESHDSDADSSLPYAAAAAVGVKAVDTACEISATVRGGAGSGYTDQTAGKMSIVVEYLELQ